MEHDFDFGSLCLKLCPFMTAICLQKFCYVLMSHNFLFAHSIYDLENILERNKSLGSVLKYVVPLLRDNNIKGK